MPYVQFARRTVARADKLAAAPGLWRAFSAPVAAAWAPQGGSLDLLTSFVTAKSRSIAARAESAHDDSRLKEHFPPHRRSAARTSRSKTWPRGLASTAQRLPAPSCCSTATPLPCSISPRAAAARGQRTTGTEDGTSHRTHTGERRSRTSRSREHFTATSGDVGLFTGSSRSSWSCRRRRRRTRATPPRRRSAWAASPSAQKLSHSDN